MAHEVVMPQLGLAMEAGRIAAWLKASGEMEHPGQPLIEVESDKANIEVEAVAAGILQIVTPAGPDDIPVGSVIAYLRAEDEAAPEAPSTVVPAVDTPPAPGAVTPPSPLQAAATRRLPSSPAARPRARELSLD